MPDIDALILGTVNVSLRRSIDAATLARCLEAGTPPLGWLEHVRAFFEDVPREAMSRFLLAHRLAELA